MSDGGVDVADLENITPDLADGLRAVGIGTRADLQRLGSVAAYNMLLRRDPSLERKTKGLFNRLEGALQNRHRSTLPRRLDEAMLDGDFRPDPGVYAWKDGDPPKADD